MPEAVQAFLDAADDLLAAQQRLMPHPLSEELRALTAAYRDARGAHHAGLGLMSGRGTAAGRSFTLA